METNRHITNAFIFLKGAFLLTIGAPLIYVPLFVENIDFFKFCFMIFFGIIICTFGITKIIKYHKNELDSSGC